MLPSRHLAFAFLVGASLTGAATGFAVDRVMVGPRLCADTRDDPNVQETAKQMYDYLGLTGEQRGEGDALLSGRQRKYDLIDSLVRPQRDSVMKEYTAKFRALLTADQIKKLDEYRQEQRRLWDERQKTTNSNSEKF